MTPRLLAAQAAGPLNVALASATAVSAVAARDRRAAFVASLAAWLWVSDARRGVRLARASNRSTGSRQDTYKVVAANMLLSSTDVAGAAAALAECDADVIVTCEVDTEHRRALEAAFGSRWTATARQGFGSLETVIWARPDAAHMLPSVRVDGRWLPRAVVNFGGRPVEVVGVHLRAPNRLHHLSGWRRDHRALHRFVRSTVEDDRPLVLAGDFNSSVTHAPMRLLEGYVFDAARATGSWWVPSWPTAATVSTRLRHRLLDLDHVLVSNGLTVRRHRTMKLPGSDHRAVVVTVSPSSR